jgi:hypothetical protein
MHETKKSADAWNRSRPGDVFTLGLGNEEATMRNDSARPTATIHPFPLKPKAVGSKSPEAASPLAATVPGGSVACFDSWYHDEAIQDAAMPRRDPLPPGPRLRPV